MCTKRAAVSTTGNLWAKEVPEEWQMQEKYTWGLLEYQSRGDRLVFIVKSGCMLLYQHPPPCIIRQDLHINSHDPQPHCHEPKYKEAYPRGSYPQLKVILEMFVGVPDAGPRLLVPLGNPSMDYISVPYFVCRPYTCLFVATLFISPRIN